MSRAATATPPQPYFPQRTTTPTMRHASASASAVHFGSRQTHHSQSKRKVKQLPSLGALAPAKKLAVSVAQDGFLAEGAPAQFAPSRAQSSPMSGVQSADAATFHREPSSPTMSLANSVMSVASVASVADSTTTSMYDSMLHDVDGSLLSSRHARADSIPSMTSSTADSFASTQLPTPDDGSFIHPGQPGLGLMLDTSVPHIAIAPSTPTPVKGSWVPNFGRMAKAMVTSGMSMGFGDRKQRREVPDSQPQLVQQPPAQILAPVPVPAPAAGPITHEYEPQARYSRPPIELLQGKSDAEVEGITREWFEAEYRRIHECARLCSQFPQSGYNLAKWGPNGAKTYYEPQSSANPDHVRSVMQRQAELERHVREHSGSFFPCLRSRDSCGDSDTDPSIDSYDSSLPSPTASTLLSTDEALAALTAANLRAAMASPLLDGGLPNASQISLLLTASPKSIKGQRSLAELDMLASSMHLSRDESMDVDVDVDLIASQTSVDGAIPTRQRILPPTRPIRAQSCGSKRPLMVQGEGLEEEKRRKVDEAMVMEEAVDTGVIMPARHATVSHNPRMSASTPDLCSARSVAAAAAAAGTESPAVFGHVVKTSDTHPIIISPFFPDQLLPILAQHLVVPPPSGLWSTNIPLLLRSDIDVPSLLLSFASPAPMSHLSGSGTGTAAIVPSPVQSSFDQRWRTPTTVGNLLLSSCPGKRLRMEGPVKGRGPVCRDLATDLRRIKGEGVGCVVCCLDDAELALLGVPWETYREIAAETGLDVIRLPMPDGFTPVSIPMFDSQIALIATKYSLRGINVLVHCRGGVGRAGLTACAWAIKMGFVQPHPSLAVVEEAALRQSRRAAASSFAHSSASSGSSRAELPAELEHQIVMSVVERVIAMIRSRRGLKAIESFEQVQFLAAYIRWLRAATAESTA